MASPSIRGTGEYGVAGGTAAGAGGPQQVAGPGARLSREDLERHARRLKMAQMKLQQMRQAYLEAGQHQAAASVDDK